MQTAPRQHETIDFLSDGLTPEELAEIKQAAAE
jgi:hypothetical protein